MNADTINDAMTMQGGAEGALLAGRYRVVRQLGQGGMGSVWLAEDTQLDNKLFAIKMLPSILVSNKRAYRQLKDEALVAMQLVHPNIVQIRAFEENNGNPFLVMDYIDGETLDDYLAEYDSRVEHVERVEGDVGRDARPARPSGGLSEDEVVRLLKPIAAALDYAHGEGVVHRDVKPANVMIRKDGHPFILDFGIAREIQETMTRVTGKLSSGTLLYMSPEQLNGDAPKKEQDIYSFAAMVYECLKGEPPFVRGAIEDQIKNKVPDPPVGRIAPATAESVGRGDPTAPLVAGIMAGLAKKPEDRPPTCVAVLAGEGFSHKEHKEHKAVGRRNPSPTEGARSSRPLSGNERKGGGVGRALVAAALFVAIASGAWWWMKEGTKGTDRTDGTDSPPVVSVPSPESDDAEEWAKAEAVKIRVEAKVWQSKMSRISNADGLFGIRKNVLADLFARAEAHFDEKVGSWSEAAQEFTNYVVQCEEMQKLNDEWLSAKESRDKSVEARRRAKSANAEKYAPVRWREANNLMEKGDNEFVSMRFAESGTTFASAAEQFWKCEAEAKDERARREDEVRKERERQELLTREKREREEREARGREELEVERKSKVEAEIKLAKDKFNMITAQGYLRQLDWRSALQQLKTLKGELSTSEGHLAADLEIRKVNDMKKVHDIFVKNLNGHVFRGKLKGSKVTDVNEREILLVKADGKSNLKISWQEFYKYYPGNLNELMHTFIVNARASTAKYRLSPSEWADAMTGAALTMKIICAEINGAIERSEMLAKQVVMQFPEGAKTLQEIFPDIEFEKAADEKVDESGVLAEGWISARRSLKIGAIVKSRDGMGTAVVINDKVYDEGDLLSISNYGIRFTWQVSGLKTGKIKLMRVQSEKLAMDVPSKIDMMPVIVERNKVQLWEGGPYWADRNIGAENPWDYGYYFWWGDTVGYKRVNDIWVASDGSTSNFSFEPNNTPTDGKNIGTLRNEGWITSDNVFALEHDAARVQWGGGWRMPTMQELSDLGNKCDWTWTTLKGVNGYEVRGRGDFASNSIFLPAAGYGGGTSLYDASSHGYYWSSVPYSSYSNSWDLDFHSSDHGTYDDSRNSGFAVRPVQGFTK